MGRRWREVFASKVGAAARWDCWDFIALAIAVFTAVWVFALKLKTFYDLGYSGDLFVNTQLARSWLEGRGLLQDNWSGNFLAIHAYFLLVPLGLIAKPFGAPGLLFVLAASVGVTYFWATRILRLLGVAGRVAVIAVGALLISPLSVAFYQEAGYGFFVETLALALCLVLFYFLLQRRVIASIVTALVVISVKEDAPIAAAVVAMVAGVETMYARHSLDRLGVVAPGSLSSPGALFVFVASNVANWLGSNVVRQWLWVMIIGTFGTILLRPYYLVVGVPTTVVAWLMNRNDLLWAPRFAPTEALLWCVTLVGFASIVRTVSDCSKWMQTALLTTAIAIAALSTCAQVALVPWFVRGAYLLRSTSLYSPSERQQADAVFGRYRREAKPEEPVVASFFLLRYAHDRNLFWLTQLRNRPAPVWILGDSADVYIPTRISPTTINAQSGIHLEDYAIVERRGRFVLLRKRE